MPIFSSGRPMYPLDEQRLRSSLTMNTASVRDEAIIVLALRSGFRHQSLSLIRHDLHIHELSDEALEIAIPGCNTTRLMDFRQIIVGSDRFILLKCIRLRGQISPDKPFLFITRRGSRITCDSCTMVLSDLSVAAGYGKGFFLSHSFRVGYASRIAAEGFSRNETTEQVYERLCDGKR